MPSATAPFPTRAERLRWRWIRETGCILCLFQGCPGTPPDIHHLTDAGRRLGHRHTIGLCPSHHRGRRGVISLDSGRKAFERRYGYTEQELLWLQDQAIFLAREQAGQVGEIEGLDPPLQRAA